MYGHMDAWNWAWMALFWIATVALIVFVVVKAINGGRRR